jgi:hypothetical protein
MACLISSLLIVFSFRLRVRFSYLAQDPQEFSGMLPGQLLEG